MKLTLNYVEHALQDDTMMTKISSAHIVQNAVVHARGVDLWVAKLVKADLRWLKNNVYQLAIKTVELVPDRVSISVSPVLVLNFLITEIAFQDAQTDFSLA